MTDRKFLKLTVPFMLSTLTQPLMGAVNTAVMGYMPDPKYIAAVSLGAILFNTIYWLFGFLRVSTTGYAAQAYGARSGYLGMLAFFKPLVIALLVGFACILLQRPIISFYLGFMQPAGDVEVLCRTYFDILIWGAPLVLLNYVALGWLMGQTMIRASVFMQMSMNILNMILSVAFVYGLGWGVEGVAWATLLCQIYGALLSVAFMHLCGRFDYKSLPWKEILDWHNFLSMLQVNANLMIRTACLMAVNNMIAAVGVSLGTTVLAANAVLLQIKDIMSFLLDGVANGSSVFAGKAAGARSIDYLKQDIRISFKWGFLFSIILMAGYWLGRDFIIGFFTDIDAVRTAAGRYELWVLLYPLCGFTALVLYGVFSGITWTAPVRNMMAFAAVVFFAAQYFLVPLYGNDGLWAAVLLFMAAQSCFLGYMCRFLERRFRQMAS
ncbi:MAG: MATE family efflux transporter [Succiniclasticum sp.]|nr:MATE family efflux transporter [Succiniclasticum sp.]MEE3479714.1 MATE family efflux transporter [Succiniclasticum sp.]